MGGFFWRRYVSGANSSPLVAKLRQSYPWPEWTRWLNFRRSKPQRSRSMGGGMPSTKRPISWNCYTVSNLLGKKRFSYNIEYFDEGPHHVVHKSTALDISWTVDIWKLYTKFIKTCFKRVNVNYKLFHMFTMRAEKKPYFLGLYHSKKFNLIG